MTCISRGSIWRPEDWLWGTRVEAGNSMKMPAVQVTDRHWGEGGGTVLLDSGCIWKVGLMGFG